MCGCDSILINAKPRLSLNEKVKRYDPTRTTALRNKFVGDIRKRFRTLRGSIYQAVVVDDCFGLMGNQELTGYAASPGRKAFAFPRSGDKLGAFMDWLNRQVEMGILETRQMAQIGSAVESAWTNTYIQDSYKRGVLRARYEMGKAGFSIPSIESSGGIDAVMGTPFHIDRIGLLYTRTFSDLKGVTDAMDSQISRILSQGLADGDHPRLLARKMNATISGSGMGELKLTDSLGRFIPAERRAMMLARMETIRAHHQATIQEYKNWELEEVYVEAEWTTTDDLRVCDQCAGMHGRTFSLDEAMNMLPAHPNCRCIMLPKKKEAALAELSEKQVDSMAKGYMRGLDTDQREAMQFYMDKDTPYYAEINHFHRQGNLNDFIGRKYLNQEGLKEITRLLDQSLHPSRGIQLKQDTQLFRAMSSHGMNANTLKQWRNLGKGDILMDKAYTSTTSNRAVLNTFVGVDDAHSFVLNIRTKSGTRVFPVGGDEAEILFARNTQMRVIDTVTRGNTTTINLELL
jgi:SPP1 gp7 family putative phage head morphogenesis protein